jgi:hypothetical protein
VLTGDFKTYRIVKLVVGSFGLDSVILTESSIPELGVTLLLAVPWLRRLVAGLSPRRPRFDPRPVHLGFVVDKVALGQVFSLVLLFSLSISFYQCSITWKNEKN